MSDENREPPSPPPPPAHTPPPPPGSMPPPPPGSLPPPPAGAGADAPTLQPTSAKGREPILDVLRGFALLGILLVNIELMRGSLFYDVLAGDLPEPAEGLDRALQFAVGWLATGKFISSFAIMFGVGAALIAARAASAGRAPGGLLARRYGWLMLFGLAHMTLLFSGDILFIYGVTGMVLLAFLNVRQRTALLWSAGLIALATAFSMLFAWLGAVAGGPQTAGQDGFTTGMEDAFTQWGARAVEAHTEGSYLDVIRVHMLESAFIQTSQLILLPWLLGLFLLGYVIGRSGIVADVAASRSRLRTAALVGLGVGLPLSFAQGAVEPIVLLSGASGGQVSTGIVLLIALGQQLGAPILAVGYLATLALLCLALGPIRPLAAVGRMALTAYLAQSALALVVFAGFSQYDQLTYTQAMGVVVGIWAVLLVACPLWLRRFAFGPVEWLWRTLTYGRGQRLRRNGAVSEQSTVT